MTRTRIHPDDAPDLQTDTEAGTHEADTSSVHGIADTTLLSTTAHDHDADYEAAGGIATHEADTSVHGIADTTVLATDAEVATAVSDHAAAANPHPTYETAAEVLAQIGTHEGLADPHPGYLTPAEGNAAYETTGAVAAHEADVTNVHAHTSLSAVGIDDHHARDHAINAAVHTGTLDDAQIPAGIARDAEVAAGYSPLGHSHAGGLGLTTVEVSLGTAPTSRRSGRFTIAGAGMTIGKPVLIQQASGPYTGKGTRTDEAEMDLVVVTGKVTSATVIECFWKSQHRVRGSVKFDYVVSA